MAKFSIMLFGIDSYTKNKMQLPYKLDAKSSDAALREARMCAMTFYPRFSETEKTDSDDFYIGTASAIYCATGFPRPLNRNQMGAMLGISEDTMIEKVVYNDFDCAYKIDFQGFNLDDTIKDEVEVKKLGIGIYCSGEILIPLVTEDRHMVGIICQSHLAPLEDEIKNNGFIRYYQRKQTDGTVYYVVKNGMRVRAAVMAYTVPDYAEAKLQELVAMLAETHIGEQEEPEQTFDDLNAEKDSEQQE